MNYDHVWKQKGYTKFRHYWKKLAKKVTHVDLNKGKKIQTFINQKKKILNRLQCVCAAFPSHSFYLWAYTCNNASTFAGFTHANSVMKVFAFTSLKILVTSRIGAKSPRFTWWPSLLHCALALRVHHRHAFKIRPARCGFWGKDSHAQKRNSSQSKHFS